jgi:hypothetical protein
MLPLALGEEHSLIGELMAVSLAATHVLFYNICAVLMLLELIIMN